MNKVSLAVTVSFILIVVALSLNAFPWYLSITKTDEKYTSISVLTKDNILLSISYTKPKNSDAIVILIHDFGSNKEMWWNLGLPKRLVNFNNAVVAFDLRFHGNSTPALSSKKPPVITVNISGYITDIETIVSWARKNLGDYPIILIGYGSINQIIIKYVNTSNNLNNIKGIVLIWPSDDLLKKVRIGSIPNNIKVLVVSDNIAWQYRPVTLIQAKVSNDSILLDGDEMDLLLNWIKDVSLKR